MNTATDLQQRWDAFLFKINERFQEILSQAAAILPELLDYQQFDTIPFTNAWTGINAQSKELIAKIDTTWHNTVSPGWETWRNEEEDRLNEAGTDSEHFHSQFYEIYYREQEKGRKLMLQLEKDLRNYEVKTFAAAGRKLAAKAHEVLSGEFSCSQCQAPLPVQANFYRSYYQVCQYCQTTNTFEPGTIARMTEHFALDPIAEEQALDQYWEYWELLQQYSAQREEDEVTITAVEVLAAYTTYIDVYLKARINMIPVYQERYDADKKAKIAWLSKYTLGIS
ncbi:hypothetical protein [Chitinophaga deserti]|uniref:hypothetical protein n=1 Tax=Chitinophaga deserti TaxID=2164099 RepID=UPI000D6B9C5F|nr:hypothetical protein [Chitinophaga deserti]